MRRKDREMNKDFGYHVIDKANYGTISICDENETYSLPLSIVRDKDSLYFHSAKEGQKVELLTNNPTVSVVFVGDTKIPENFTKEELENIALDESKTALLISSVFTTEFESTIVKGKSKLVVDEDERIHAMQLICEKYTPSKIDYFDIAVRSGLKRVNVYKISIETITSKRKKYDKHGKEMKYSNWPE